MKRLLSTLAFAILAALFAGMVATSCGRIVEPPAVQCPQGHLDTIWVYHASGDSLPVVLKLPGCKPDA